MKIEKIIIVIALLPIAFAILYFGLIIIGGGIISGVLFNPRINQAHMERIFIEDYDLLRVVVDYLTNSEHASISVRPETDYGMMWVGSINEHITIEDEYVRYVMNLLLSRGYQNISKTGNFVVFLRWRNLDNGRGVVYSIDRTLPDESTLSFLTRLESLPYQGWFYYEEDFNEFRIRQRNNQ